jgi:hypothetical protein
MAQSVDDCEIGWRDPDPGTLCRSRGRQRKAIAAFAAANGDLTKTGHRNSGFTRLRAARPASAPRSSLFARDSCGS